MSLIPFAGAVQKFNRQRGEYQIERSLRFNSADSAYLSRTPASAGNRKTWTWSGWVKRSKLGSSYFEALFAVDPSPRQYIAFYQDKLYTYGPSIVEASTVALFRDVSAWYHVVGVWDTTQATGSDRMKIYVNGVQQTLSFTTTPTLNLDGAINTTQAHTLGGENSTYPQFNGYLTEINFIDGQALTPSSFGEYNTDTGVWQPKAYSGSYGTNGFYLNFSDNSGTTSTTLGKDQAGSNNWTPNNFSVTAGAGNDSLVDTPTPYGDDTGAGGEVRGNYATLNPLRNTGTGSGTITNGNLQINGTQSLVNCIAAGTMMLAGKMYWEFTVNTMANSGTGVGIVPITNFLAFGAGSQPTGIYYLGNGNKRVTGTTTAYGSTYTSGDVIGIAVDVDAETITFYKNNVSQGSISGTGVIASGVLPYIGMDDSNSPSVTANFGQRPFAYTAPSGFKALCTQNLPEPTIKDGGDYFNTVLYTGTGSARSVTGVGFQPDAVWVKCRSSARSHNIQDAVRGSGYSLFPNETTAEINDVGARQISFDSDGFSISGTNQGDLNLNAATFVAWNWKAGNSNVTNTDGTITSTVRANPTAGFSIVTYTGTGANATVGHGLGVAPAMVIIKERNGTGFWVVGHTSLGWSYYTRLNDTLAVEGPTAVAWNNTAPSSTVVSLGTSNILNNSGSNLVMYCFAPVAGYSAFGSYTGNGSTDGSFVYLGFRPAFVMIKTSSNAGYNWNIHDTARNPYNSANLVLYPNTSAGDDAYSAGSGLDILSNGFKARDAGGGLNGSGFTYIYAAFSEAAFKNSLAR